MNPLSAGNWKPSKKKPRAYGEDFAGRLTESADTLLAAFQKRDDIWRRILEKIYVYARMRRDENNAETKCLTAEIERNSVIAAVSASMAFTPELLSVSEETILAYIDAAPGLEIYRFAICDTMRQKAHILTTLKKTSWLK